MELVRALRVGPVSIPQAMRIVGGTERNVRRYVARLAQAGYRIERTVRPFRYVLAAAPEVEPADITMQAKIAAMSDEITMLRMRVETLERSRAAERAANDVLRSALARARGRS